MASSSKSNPQWTYDVFINFRGEDTRKHFVAHLYSALSNAGINTFLDDEKLTKGEKLRKGLFRAIEGSHICVVVFSKNYTESSWCLAELEKILECQRTYGQVVLPVFYDVAPSQVRHQEGAFGDALKALAQRNHNPRNTNKPWKAVLMDWSNLLYEATKFSGWDVRNHRNEAKVVKEIVEDIFTKLDSSFLPITEFPVGLASRVQEVIKFIENESNEVCIIGIWGMGGSGKTTVAKAIYNQIYRSFNDRSFIEDIREICERDDSGKVYLHEQLLEDILKTKVKIHSVGMGTATIVKKLSGRRVLVVLDDVNEFRQLKYLCGNIRNWIGQGSIIVVTTRDARLLNLLEVDHVYEMKEMDENESLELFSWHAFREAKPGEDLNELATNVVAYCGGLPLALEVLGSYLSKRTEKEWRSVLSKLEVIPNDQVQQKLRISFDGLCYEMEKDIFLDVCCFFIGKDRAYVTEILNGCGLHADIGITVLIERSLIKVEKNNKLGMHHLLRDMGREIIRESFTKEPGKRSRLWFHEDVLDVLTNNTGTQAIEGLTLKLHESSRDCFKANAFEQMKIMRLLQLDHVRLTGDYGCLSKQLRWVYWQGFPSKYIPDNFYLGSVIVIDLRRSNLKQAWKEPQVLWWLTILNLSHSKYLTKTPDFSKLPNLEKLILKDCPSLCAVHQSIGDLRKLLLINLKDCTSLSNLPTETYKLKSVKTLILSGCSKINKLEEDIVQMESLTTLIADNTAVKQVPFSIVTSKSIGYISICGFEGLSRNVFPSIIWSWMSPSMSPLLHTCPFRGMSSSLVSMDVQNNNFGDLAVMLSSLSNLRSVLVQCDTVFQLSKLRGTILDDANGVTFMESETTSSVSQISTHSLKSYLIGIGSRQDVFDTLRKSILEVLKTNGCCDAFLMSDNYPYWLTHIGEGHSVFFIVPEDNDWHMKGMALCVFYSSTTEKMVAECLIGVLIVNYTKCTIQIYKQDTTISFNDEDWQGMKSNLGAGDKIEIFVAFRHGLIIKKTAVFLICDRLIAIETESSLEKNVQPSSNVTMEPSLEVNMQPSVNMTTMPSPKPMKSICARLAKRMGECLSLNRNRDFNNI